MTQACVPAHPYRGRAAAGAGTFLAECGLTMRKDHLGLGTGAAIGGAARGLNIRSKILRELGCSDSEDEELLASEVVVGPIHDGSVVDQL
jgi:hypothetical protein